MYDGDYFDLCMRIYSIRHNRPGRQFRSVHNELNVTAQPGADILYSIVRICIKLRTTTKSGPNMFSFSAIRSMDPPNMWNVCVSVYVQNFREGIIAGLLLFACKNQSCIVRSVALQ